MPSRKQRRRREKQQRHEYEYVLLDEEGNELPVDPAELKKKETNGKARTAPKTRSRRAARTVQPPSWRRVGKRALIFAPVMFVMISILGGHKVSMVGKLAQTALLLGFFLPFSYMMDSFAYRAYRKRMDRGGG